MLEKNWSRAAREEDGMFSEKFSVSKRIETAAWLISRVSRDEDWAVSMVCSEASFLPKLAESYLVLIVLSTS